MKPIQEQTILITGATDGLGKEVARRLAKRGARVLLHGRNPEKGKQVMDEIARESDVKRLRYYNADLSSLEEVARLADQIKANEKELHLLINNAGIGPGKRNEQHRETSKDGHELRFAVNYLAPFLLTSELIPLLASSAPSRIVNVASVGQEALDFEDLMLENEYDGMHAYRQSKLADIMFTFELAEKLDEKIITVNCLHPATLMDTQMVREAFTSIQSSVDRGADALEYVATSRNLDGVTGKYFNEKQISRAMDQAYDIKARQRLWTLSEEFIKLAV